MIAWYTCGDARISTSRARFQLDGFRCRLGPGLGSSFTSERRPSGTVRTYRTESRYEMYVLFVFGGGQCEPYSCTYLRTGWQMRVRGGKKGTQDILA